MHDEVSGLDVFVTFQSRSSKTGLTVRPKPTEEVILSALLRQATMKEVDLGGAIVRLAIGLTEQPTHGSS